MVLSIVIGLQDEHILIFAFGNGSGDVPKSRTALCGLCFPPWAGPDGPLLMSVKSVFDNLTSINPPFSIEGSGLSCDAQCARFNRWVRPRRGALERCPADAVAKMGRLRSAHAPPLFQ